MDNQHQFDIVPHEHGWALVKNGVHLGAFPTYEMAMSGLRQHCPRENVHEDGRIAFRLKTVTRRLKRQFIDAIPSNHRRNSQEPQVMVPHNVDLTLPRHPLDQVSVPASINGAPLFSPGQ